MPRLNRALLIALAVVALLAVAAWFAAPSLAVTAMGRMYEEVLGRDQLAKLPDGLHVGLCGTGAPMPDPGRAGPCVAVVAGKRLFVVDTGSGSTRNLALMNLPPAEVEALLLTHFHSDHIADLGELMLQHWGAGAATTPLPVYGPEGVDRVVAGFQAAYALDRGYRIAHHGEATMPPAGFGGAPRPFAVGPADTVLIDDGGLKVTAFPVSHDPVDPAVGYRFDYKGRSVVISGDTTRSDRLVRAARGADVLAHEALAPNLVALQRQAALKNGATNVAKVLADIPPYHAAPEVVAAEAKAAGVRSLLLYHIIPPLPVRVLERPFLGDTRAIFGGPVQIGRDGDLITLPANSTAIQRDNVLRSFL